MLTSRNIYLLPALVAGCLVLGACSDPSGPGDGDVRIQALARNRVASSFAAVVHGEASQSASLVTAVRIDRVLLVLGRVKLEKADGWDTDFVEERSIVVSLVPDADPKLVWGGEVPAGRFKEVELAFDKLEPGKAQEEGLIQQYPGLANASVLVEGKATVDGAERAFSFAGDFDMDVEVQFDTPLDFDADLDPALLSLVLDVGGWFRDGSGRWLDPNASADRSAIEGNIQRSIHFFEDPELDGR